VRKFIYANVVVYIILVLIGVFSVLLNAPSLVAAVKSWLELPASLVSLAHKPWTVFTYMFMHGGLMHILWNMFALYLFGRIFLDFFSVRHFVGVYLLGGLSGALFFVLAYNVFPYFAGVVDVAHLVGASAAVLAVVTAAAVRSPEYRISLLFFGSVKLSTFAIFTVCISVLMLSGGNAGGNFAHLGGALGGYLFALMLGKGYDVTDVVCRPADWLKSLFERLRARRVKKRKFTYSPGGKHGADYEHNARKKADEAEIDAILEKIKKGGYASLSEKEKMRLFDASSK
jgi:membrane associated rhomboid family serine protease